MASREELSAFLASVERRAYKQTVFAVRDEHAAMDVVQEAMIKLTRSYAERPVTEYPMLFQRILQNATTDHFRRQKVRSLWTTLFSSLTGPEEDDDHDPLETLEPEIGSGAAESAADEFQRKEMMEILEQEISKLPGRQREAFLLRYWEDCDVAETAELMGCSEGSVKTHCSRATHALAKALKAKGITL